MPLILEERIGPGKHWPRVNPWFERDLTPEVRKRVRHALRIRLQSSRDAHRDGFPRL
jgi:hypothetical protein